MRLSGWGRTDVGIRVLAALLLVWIASLLGADFDHGREAAAALFFDVVVGCVVGDVAVEEPLAGLACGPDDVVAFARADVDRVLEQARSSRDWVAVGGDDLERATMNVHRVDEVVVGTDEADADAFADAHSDPLR